MTVQERVVTGVAQFNLDILRTPATEFRRHRSRRRSRCSRSSAANIKTWGFKDEARRQLRVTFCTRSFIRPLQHARRFRRARPRCPGTLAAPAFKVEGAARERGFLRIRSAEGVGLRPVSLENVFQADLNTLPKQIRGGANALGFRFPALPYALSASARSASHRSCRCRQRLRVTVADRHSMKTRTRSLNFTSGARRHFQPDGSRCRRAWCSRRSATASSSTRYRESEVDGKRILTIALRGRRIGKFTSPRSRGSARSTWRAVQAGRPAHQGRGRGPRTRHARRLSCTRA